MINKKLGNDFEQELCEILADAGYWVHNFANRKNGQPADIIAVKNTKARLIDAKVCSRDLFDFRRVEDNQQLAMDMWISCGNIEPCFALKCSDGIYVIKYCTIMDLKLKGKKWIWLEDIKKYGVGLSVWLKNNR